MTGLPRQPTRVVTRAALRVERGVWFALGVLATLAVRCCI